MTSIPNLLTNALKSIFGHPVALERVLNKYGDISVDLTPEQNVSANSVIRWEELGIGAHPHGRSQGWVLGWGMQGGVWQSLDYQSANLASIMVQDSSDDWACDIRLVEGLSASKSELKDFLTLDQMAEVACQGLIEDVSPEGLAKNLAWSEIRIVNQKNTTDHFRHYAWDRRIHLINDGGSHHFAAARYLAGKLNTPVQLTGRLKDYNLSSKHVQGLREEFDMYPIKNCQELFGDIMDALRDFDASFCLMDLPSPFSNNKVFMLPKHVPRSVAASKFLAQAGLPELGAHLEDLCDKQTFIL
jgi:hypothetical protein